MFRCPGPIALGSTGARRAVQRGDGIRSERSPRNRRGGERHKALRSFGVRACSAAPDQLRSARLAHAEPSRGVTVSDRNARPETEGVVRGTKPFAALALEHVPLPRTNCARLDWRTPSRPEG